MFFLFFFPNRVHFRSAHRHCCWLSSDKGRDDLFGDCQAVTVTIMLCNGTPSPGVLTCVTATDVNGQGARGAERGRSVVSHLDGQEVHVLLVAVEARPLRPDTSCVV